MKSFLPSGIKREGWTPAGPPRHEPDANSGAGIEELQAYLGGRLIHHFPHTGYHGPAQSVYIGDRHPLAEDGFVRTVEAARMILADWTGTAPETPSADAAPAEAGLTQEAPIC
jgi:hypothetical protein